MSYGERLSLGIIIGQGFTVHILLGIILYYVSKR